MHRSHDVKQSMGSDEVPYAYTYKVNSNIKIKKLRSRSGMR